MTDPALPDQIGRYRPLAVLGAGGMGVVYRAHDPLIDRQVAIKLVRTDALADDGRAEYLERFRREAQAAGRCSHPAIVAVHDFSSEPPDPYIVMELVEGATLQQMLRGPAGRAAVPAILAQVLDGLGYAHRLGVIHRDIKPANIVVTAAGHAKIADFGIARLSDTALTLAGDMLGTPSYMAPEQLVGAPVDHRADLFAVGCILYEAFAGRPPFAGRSMAETLQRLAAPEPASMVAIEAAGAGAHVALLRRALAKPPAQRFQSAEAFATALQSASASAPPPMPRFDETVPLRPAAVPRWDSSTLHRVERALAHYLGPMARMAVAQAAARATTAEDLYQALAASLQTAADRSGFLRTLGGTRVEPTLDPPPRGEPTLAAPPTASIPAGPIPAAALAAAQGVLAGLLGPMARVLVRQAAAEARSAPDFIDRLCAHAKGPDEAAALRRKLRAEVEPRLR